eukprot:6745514-Ditylum_brightwellii.AAC.1
MLRKKIWNSLTLEHQLELLTEQASFQKGNNYDGVLLWYHMIKQVNLSTKVSVKTLKNKLENANLKDFNQDIKRFNQWFKDKRTLIIKELKKDGYKEYTHYLYKVYLTCTDPKFLRKMEDEQQNWMLERKKPLYSHQNLMDLVLKMYNHQKAMSNWKPISVKDSPDKSTNPKFLALVAEQLKLMKEAMAVSKTGNNKSNGRNKGPKTDDDNGVLNARGRVIPIWRFSNPNGKPQLIKNGTTFNWREKDCRVKPMWCAQNPCYSRAEFGKQMEEKKKSLKAVGKVKASDDFKVALSAMLTKDEYKAIESQFLN